MRAKIQEIRDDYKLLAINMGVFIAYLSTAMLIYQA